MADRDSQSGELDLIEDEIEKARVEALNALRQTKAAMESLPSWIRDGKPNLRPSFFLGLHGILMERISRYPGVFRPGQMAISHSQHTPPPARDVPALIEELCDYVNGHWSDRSALHLASYVLWRTNWIHPFSDGNGRTARIVSYLVLCAHTRTELPGTPTIPEQIASSKTPYYNALESADREFRSGTIDVSDLEALLEACLARQLVEFFRTAGGRTDEISDEVRAEIDDAITSAQAEGLSHRDAQPILPSIKRRRGLLDVIEKRPVLYSSLVAIIIALIGWLIAH